jgi:hypothetical protein
MDSQRPSLRRGELLAGASALAVLVILFALHWLRFTAGSRTGWESVPVLRWFIVAAALTGLALVVAQATMRGPALPASLSTVGTVLAVLATVLLLIRLVTTGATPQIGAYLGLVALAALTGGCSRSLREEQGWTPGPDRPIETVLLRTPRP